MQVKTCPVFRVRISSRLRPHHKSSSAWPYTFLSRWTTGSLMWLWLSGWRLRGIRIILQVIPLAEASTVWGVLGSYLCASLKLHRLLHQPFREGEIRFRWFLLLSFEKRTRLVLCIHLCIFACLRHCLLEARLALCVSEEVLSALKALGAQVYQCHKVDWDFQSLPSRVTFSFEKKKSSIMFTSCD